MMALTSRSLSSSAIYTPTRGSVSSTDQPATRTHSCREAGRQGGREAGRQGGREAGRQGGREAGRQGGREGGREGGRAGGDGLSWRGRLEGGQELKIAQRGWENLMVG